MSRRPLYIGSRIERTSISVKIISVPGGSPLTLICQPRIIGAIVSIITGLAHMRSFLIALATLPLLAACDGAQPFAFTVEGPDGQEEVIDTRDPNVDVNNKFLYDIDKGMTMNSVEYDADNNELIINNLPFDGPSGRYDHERNLRSGAITTDLYNNLDRRTATEAQVSHYAVFVRSEHVDAVAAMGNWGNFGYGGANLNRSGFSLPNDGEYVYVGAYAGVRSFNDRGGIEIVTGEARVLLDVLDFDPFEGIQGAIVGTISDRQVTTPDGAPRVGLPVVFLEVTQFNTEDGTFVPGNATTYFPDGSPRDSGSYDGYLAGESSPEMAGHILIEGSAYFQNVRFHTVTYELTDDLGVVTTHIYNSLNADNLEGYQQLVDQGLPVGLIEYSLSDLPDGADVIEVEINDRDFTSDFNAQEVGVFVATAIEP